MKSLPQIKQTLYVLPSYCIPAVISLLLSSVDLWASRNNNLHGTFALVETCPSPIIPAHFDFPPS